MGSEEARYQWESAGGSAPEHWQFLPFVDLLETPKSLSVGVMYPGGHTPNGIPLIRVNDVKNGSVLATPTYFVSPKVDEEHKRTRLNGSELIITLVGEPGDCVVADPSMAGWNVARALAVARLADPSLRRWIRHVLLSGPAKHLIDSRLNTTVQKTLNLKDIKELGIPLPPKGERDSISNIIASLDDKIELNRRMNATLEGMAQALFKSWFVDFDPVIDNAIKAGNLIPDELADRAEVRRQALADGTANCETAEPFPAAFQETDSMGWIPEEWRITKLKDCTTKIGSGSTPRGGSSAYIGKGTRLVRSQNIHDSSFRWNGIVCITEEAAEKLKGVTLTERDVLINITGDSILRTCIVDPTVLPARVNQHVAILRPKENIPTQYMHQYIVREEYKTYLLGFDAGGSRSAITKGHLEEAEMLLPQDAVLREFNRITDCLNKRKNKNEEESKTLTKLRDTLLPKLISGELRLPEVKKLVESSIAKSISIREILEF
jgi:type I restriction enzyme S subunit